MQRPVRANSSALPLRAGRRMSERMNEQTNVSLSVVL